MKKKLYLLFSVLALMLIFTACVKDTDFDQAENIALTPIIELNLIHFDIDADSFFDEVTSTEILTVRDTTEIRFLDDEEIQESLISAEFYFKFTNSIPRDFLVDFQFLSEMNDTTYVIQTPVIQGTIQEPMITEHIELLAGDDILELTKANKVIVSVNIPSADENLEGNLNLQSKTTYTLEF